MRRASALARGESSEPFGSLKSFIIAASQRGVIHDGFVPEGLEVHILRGHIDIRVIALCNYRHIASVREHAL